MQDNLNDIDFQLRSILQDAEIKPSRRVWKGISAQLDAAQESNEALGWGGWAYASLAFVAAVALFLFLTPVKQAENIYSVPQLRAETPSIKHPDIERCRPLLADAHLSQPQIKESQVAVLSEDTIVQSNNTSSGQDRNATSFRKRFGTFGSSDPFAEDDDNDSHHGIGRTSIYAKGLIGGNESSISSIRGLASMAPGVTETGIRELSDSSFGVPISLGLGVRFYFLPKFSVATGVDVSWLNRSFTGEYTTVQSGVSHTSEAGNVTHNMIYVGVPINVYYDIFDTNKLKFYAFAGGEAELCVSNKYTLHTTPKITHSSKVTKPMFSVGAGVGLEFALTDLVGIYIDPGVKYYFRSDQPRSIRTDKAIVANFDAGLRFNF